MGQLKTEWFNPSPHHHHHGDDWMSPIADFDVLGWTDLLIVPGIGPRYLGRTDRSSAISTNVRDYQYDKVAGGSGNRYLPDKVVALYMVL